MTNRLAVKHGRKDAREIAKEAHLEGRAVKPRGPGELGADEGLISAMGLDWVATLFGLRSGGTVRFSEACADYNAAFDAEIAKWARLSAVTARTRIEYRWSTAAALFGTADAAGLWRAERQLAEQEPFLGTPLLPALYSQETVPAHEKVAVIKFFCGGRGTWYATEGSVLPDGDVEFFGYVVSPLGPDCDEWGYFSLSELRSVGAMERDLYWTPGPIPLHCVGCDEHHPLTSTHPTTGDALCAGCGEAVRMPGGNMAGDEAAALAAFEAEKAAHWSTKAVAAARCAECGDAFTETGPAAQSLAQPGTCCFCYESGPVLS